MVSYWLMKTEPDAFSFEDLVSAKNATECWDGIRNYQARNLMRDKFKLGDKVFIYHSRVPEPAVVGLGKVVKEAYPDDTALDPSAKYFDSKSAESGQSRWVMVDIMATHRFRNPVSLASMREIEGLADMMVIRRGARLSIQPVAASEFAIIKKLGKPVAV